MRSFDIERQTVGLPKNLALLDTCILKAVADPRDQRHEDVQVFLEAPYSWIVPGPVIVEACGILTSQCSEREVRYLTSWLSTPGKVTLIPDMYTFSSMGFEVGVTADWMKKRSIDYVDAYLMRLADFLTEACKLRPFTPVATFDQRDFLKCATGDFRYSLIDADTLEVVDFDFS